MCLTAFKAVMEMGQWEGQEEENNNERKLIRRPPPTDRDKWNSLPEVPTRTEIGYLHLSFEYHRGALRVRVWQISDLLLPPPQISMIHSIFVRGYFLPDKVKKTNRRTEEVLVEAPDKNGVATADTGVQHIFTPSSFKFQTPLMYTGLTLAIIKERSIQLEVCMTQKNTHRVFLMAMVHMPLRTALRRPIREKYPLIPCLNLTTPNNMRVYSAALLPHLTGVKGQERKGGQQVNGCVGNGLAGKEMDLEDDVSLSGEDFLRSHLSLCLDEDSEDDSLARSGSSSVVTSQTSNSEGSGASSSSSNTLNNPSSGDDELDDNQYEDAGDYDEDLSDWGDDSARNTPLNGSLRDVSDSSASKKKIIPNELLQDDGELSDGDLTAEESGAMNGVPERSEETKSDVSTSRFASTHTSANGFQSMDSSLHSNENGLPPATSTPQDPDNAASSLSGSVRRKIVPAANSDVPKADREESCIRKDEPSHADPSQAGARDLTPTQKEESAVTAENQSNPANSPTRSTNHKDSETQPPGERVKSDGLAPAAHPTSSSSSSLSPLTDSGFSPASRPETPCWDFYDFSEDLLPEVDLESGSQRLEESLAQLRQHGIGSLQNLSMEPILPMVLVDDFDTLTVEDEKPFAVDDEKPVAVADEKSLNVEDEKAFTKDDENAAAMNDTTAMTVDTIALAEDNKKAVTVDMEALAEDDKKAVTVDMEVLAEDDKKAVTVDMEALADDDKKAVTVDTNALTVDEKIITVDKEKVLTVDGEGALTVENEGGVTVDDE